MNRSTCTWPSAPLIGDSRWSILIGVLRDRRVTEDSILAIQIFDQKKFKKKDQGFLGVINVRIGSVIDLQMGGDGKAERMMFPVMNVRTDLGGIRFASLRNAHPRPQEVER